MSKEVFEQANEAFIDDKYEQAYEVYIELSKQIQQYSAFIFSYMLKLSIQMINLTRNIHRKF